MRSLIAASVLVLASLSAHGQAPPGFTPSPTGSCSGIPNSLKINCGHDGTNQAGCEAKGCCWQPEGQGSATPWCYFNYKAKPCVANFTTGGSGNAPFSQDAIDKMRSFFLANLNIQGDGGVVAAPDYNTPGGSYYFHWMRDGALSMRTFLTITEAADNSTSTIMNYMSSYTKWVLKHQSMKDPNGIDIRVEPKFNLPDGGPYTGGWCRPQSDGPGLRTLALVKFANWLLANNQKQYVQDNLYGQNAPNGGAVFYDINYLVDNWKMNTCDLWEEVQSDDFFWNRFNFRRAFLDAADLATKMGDSTNAAKYRNAASDVLATLQAHWNGEYVFEATNRKQDAAVIAAFNNGYMGDSVFAPHGHEVAGTIATLNQLFCKTFPINQADTANGVPGIMYGRYEGDSYAGGNPWILTTGALSQLFFRAAIATANNTAGISVNKTAWAAALNQDASSWSSDMDLARSMAMAGDAVLERLNYHVKSSGYHCSEQLDKETGAEASATNLTWSYATILKALVSRGQALKILGQW